MAGSILIGAPCLLFVVLTFAPQLDVLFQSVRFHLVVVSVIAMCAVAVAAIASVAAIRAKDPALVFVGLGCLAIAIPMLGHGLVTPGVLGTPVNLWVGRLPMFAIAAFALCQAATLMAPGATPSRLVARRPWAALAGSGVALAMATAVIVAFPEAGYGSRPLPAEATVMGLVGGLSAIVLIVVGAIHWRRWRLGGDRAQFALVLASWTAAEAELSLRFGRVWHLSWWDYHLLLLIGFGTAVYAIAFRYLRTRDAAGLSGAFGRDPLAHIARGYPEALRALVAAVEARDSYTRGHSERVTEMSIRIGQQLGLAPAKLRRLAWGTLLHDIGKIGIPDRILLKEGPLTADERELIEEHPVLGWEIARHARSLREILVIIRHHHERIDGRGYPDRLEGEAIPLEARIVAVADVWDALTSDRSYRRAWEPEKALEIMVEGSGTQFDRNCLGAFLKLTAARGLWPGHDASESAPFHPIRS